MMGHGWGKIQNVLSKLLASEVPVVWLVKTLKTADTIILPIVSAKNQPVPIPTGSSNNWSFYKLCGACLGK